MDEITQLFLALLALNVLAIALFEMDTRRWNRKIRDLEEKSRRLRGSTPAQP